MNKGNKSTDFDAALEKCLDLVAEGKLSASECMRRYPYYAASMEPLLRKAEALQRMRTIRPSLGFRKQASSRLQRRIAASSRAARPSAGRSGSFRLFSFGIPRFALRGLIAVGLVFLLASFTGIAAYASDGAVPGDALYALDTGVERVQLRLAGDAQQALELHLKFAAERLEEAEALLGEGNSEHLEIALTLYDQSIKNIEATTEQIAVDEQKLAAEQVEQSLSVNQARLEELLTRVPEQARPGIERAIEASSQGRQNGDTQNAQNWEDDANTCSLPGSGNHPGEDKRRGNPHQPETAGQPTDSLGREGNGETTNNGQSGTRPGQGNSGGNGNGNANGGGRPDDNPGQGAEHGNRNGNSHQEEDNK